MDTDTGWTGSHSFTSVRQIDIQTDSLRAREFCVAHQHNCQTTGTRGQGRAGQGRAGQGRDGRSPIAIEAMSRLCTLCGCDIAPRLMRRSRARVRDSWGGAVGNGKFSTSEMPRDLI
jgi:hypothetical protein